MTKAEFTPVANALESNIDAALARIRELEAELQEVIISNTYHADDAAKLRISVSELEARLAEAEARTFNHAKEAIVDIVMLRVEAQLRRLLGPELDAAVRRAESAEARVEALRVALEQVEWVHDAYQNMMCPWCGNDQDEDGGHGSDCARQAALAEQPAESEGK